MMTQSKPPWLTKAQAIDMILQATRPVSLPVEAGMKGLEVGGKLAQGWRVGQGVRAKWADVAGGPRQAVDNAYDAQRHAEWNRRMAEELGPGYARFIAEVYEATHPGRPEANAMDRYNNRVGVRSVEEKMPYGIDDLQIAPGVPAKNAERWRRR